MMSKLYQDKVNGLDSLRAVAILGVIFFHLYPSDVPGGFLGVDIFLVLSGFLIALVLDKEPASPKVVVNFVIRRIRRLYPSMWLTLLLTICVGYFVLLPNEFYKLLTESLQASFFYFNFMQISQPGYFEPDQITDEAILNLWSLSVEFQLYLAFPLIFLISNSNSVRLLLCVPVALAAYTYSQSLGTDQDNYIFYHPVSRSWEFLSGSICYLLCQFLRQDNLAATFINPLLASRRIPSAIGLLFVILASFFFWPDPSTRQPSTFTVALVAFTCVLIISLYNLGVWHRSLMPFEFLGRISYPLYLTHWPTHYLLSKLNTTPLFVTLGTLGISLGISVFCYTIVDKWSRNWNQVKTLAFFVLGVFPLVLVSQSFFPISINPRLSDLPMMWQRVYEGHQSWGSERTWNTENEVNKPFFVPADTEQDPFQDFKNAHKAEIFIIGDSHAELIWPRLMYLREQELLPAKDIAFLTAAGCAPISNFKFPSRKCESFLLDVKAYISEAKPEVIIFHAYWDSYFLGKMDEPKSTSVGEFFSANESYQTKRANPSNLEQAFFAFENDIKFYNSFGSKVVIVDAVPASKKFDHKFMLKYLNRWSPQEDLPENITRVAKTRWQEFYYPVRSKFLEFEANGLVSYVDPLPFLCPEHFCPTERSGHPIYSDANHIGSWTVYENGVWIDQIFKIEQ